MPGIRQHDTREGGGADSVGLDISRTVLARSALRAPGIATPAGIRHRRWSLAGFGDRRHHCYFRSAECGSTSPVAPADPSRLVWITQVLRGSSTDELTITADFLDWRRLNHSFTHLAAYNHQVRNLTGVEPPAEVRTARASASLLPMLGVIPAIGAISTATRIWLGTMKFGGNRNVIGQPITLDGRPFMIIGVLP
jgi:hypothetical protein